ncbi:MAG: ABC transporter permease [Lachnospiraceae bacterium]|nr:ABC transporter permease [Lachnospiraceae bacterium]
MFELIRLSIITVKKLRRDRVRNIIIVLFVISAVFLMNIALSTFRHCEYLNTFARSSGLYDRYMYAGTPTKQVYYNAEGINKLEKAEEYVRKELDRLIAQGYVEDYYNICKIDAPIDEYENIRADFVFADEGLFDNLSFPMAKGVWFDSYCKDEYNENVVPVVIGYDMKAYFEVGQIVRFDSFDVDCIVIGILERNALFINPSAAGSGIDLNSITQISNELVIVGKEYENLEDSLIIRLSEDNLNVSEMEVLETIADVVDTFTFRKLADTAYENNLYATEMRATLAILSILTCVIGIWCENLLSSVRGKKRQAIYFLCGMDVKTGVLSTVLESFLKLYIPSFIGMWLFFDYCRREAFAELYTDWVNLFITMLIITVIFITMVIRTLLVARNNTALKIIHS